MDTRTAFAFDNTYARALPQLAVAFRPAAPRAPRLLFLNRALAAELGVHLDAFEEQALAELFSGSRVPEGAEPVAQAYAGHQFGHYSPQLGDGRAVLLGELLDRDGRRRDLSLKGSGRTVFARGGDGKAAVGPMLREVLIGEALHALGIPTTRALAVAATGETVMREQPLPGAVLARVAASHLRVGTFQYAAASGTPGVLAALAEYTIARHDPDLAGQPDRVARLLERVCLRQASLVAAWMNVGFIHGVMNTDNMALSGESIDFGPCAFMEAYDPAAVFSSIDQRGRYAYGNQPDIALWNLARFAEALLPLIDDDPERAVARVMPVLEGFPAAFLASRVAGQRAKLGLATQHESDAALADDWMQLLHAQGVDFTLAWRRLADAAAGDAAPLESMFADPESLAAWLARWRARCEAEGVDGATRAQAMRRANPFVIPRNHRVEEALSAASERGDLGPFERLLAALRRPFDEDAGTAPYGEPAPAEVTACYRTFCGT